MTNETIAIRFERTGNGLKERLMVKAFKNSNALGDFLTKQDKPWRAIVAGQNSYLNVPYPTKSGTYAAAGGQWHNVKNLDPCILAHI